MFTQWQPLSNVRSELSRLQREMNRRSDGHDNGRTTGNGVFPALNAWQNDDQYVVEAELPGLELDDLDISINAGNQLTIKGQRKSPDLDGGTWHRRERAVGEFGRTIELPGMVDSEKVVATLTAGVLKVTLPKPEEAKPRKITVKAS